MDKLEKQKNCLIDYIKNNVCDQIIQKALINLFNDVFESRIRLIKYSRDRLKIIVSWYVLAYNLINFKISDINWSNACNLYNTNYYHKLTTIAGILANEDSERKAVVAIIDRIEVRKSFDGYYDYKEAIIKLYLYLETSKNFVVLDNINEISKYKEFLINEYNIKFCDLDDKFQFNSIHKKILNNMPIGSRYEYFIQKQYILQKNNTINKVNFDCNTRNNFIKELIKNFIDEIYRIDKAPHNRLLKVFSYYIGVSLDKYLVKQCNDINYNILKNQYKFFDNSNLLDLQDKNEINNKTLTLILIQFYRFILNNYKLNFSKKEEYVVRCKSIHKILRGDYEILLFNPNESIPTTNKFCIIQSEYTMHNTAQTNNNYFIDLTELDKIIQIDLKNFLWYSHHKIEHRFNSIPVILYFLDFKKEYYKFYYKDKKKENECRYEIDENMLYMYMDKIDEEYEKNNTKKYIITQIRHFLKFHEELYNMKESYYEIISLKGLSDYDGGNPITARDLKIIYNAVKDEENTNPKMRIYTIAFEICLLTNLRIGEVLSLERNCIIDKNTIKCLRKVSERNYTNHALNEEAIILISEAIKLTDNILDNSFMSKYIFIEKSCTNFSERIKKIEFYLFFKKIIEKNNSKLENKNYRPYNLRHTYINNVYKEGVKNNLSLSEMAVIAGNSFGTAKKYYRNSSDYEMYVETLAKVKLTDTKIIGNINNNNIKVSKPVKENLGNCNEINCTFDLAECLMCKHFVTFTNRIDAFEMRIKKINKLLEKCSDNIEKGNLVCEKRLLSKYLLELLKVKEGERNAT
ncbi:phage integrase family protein [Clostridium botulinum]|uniref:DNA integration/recombination/inversion protein n=1 Tax=Clostridium botulinum TaxID=1491 RepID=R4NNG3_CLOBO|nr:DNA integration/recombination/inversion protein [Clostridium botulinum]AGL45042.1 DNA integration/recombination/inversion protein [Clostridium botulinum]AGL45082.1 DNA integration/recombination/inversion protein [Clostridium botulinum]AGL45122.1 DNA integration/recombination/inversion protein [Clostridium botulinum]AGL45162.1 DNA integration/recombination/inversion protein [Clostridium botulinum]